MGWGKGYGSVDMGKEHSGSFPNERGRRVDF